jgi:tetraacyldisaccharide 4'-kinase
METILMDGSRWRRTVYACMNGHAAPSVWMTLGLAPLWLASHLYRGVSVGHYVSYTYGMRRSKQLPCRVISIGNLTLGGTGKTPLTMWMARWYQEQGWRVVVLSRGYGAQPATPFRVVSTGDGPLLDWRKVGDEPYLLAQSLPGIPVLIGRNRYLSGCYACDQFGAQVVILDDGFQHYALRRDLDVVLVDASNPFGHGTLFPRGILREPLRALRRADAIVLTRVHMAGQTLASLCRQIRCWNARQPIYYMTTVAEALYQRGASVPTGTSYLSGRRVVAFAAIGNPRAFTTTLAQLGGEVVALMAFPDHHPYTYEDWQAIVDLADRWQVECLVTTEKDAVRLAPDWQASMPVYALRIGVRFVRDYPSLQQPLQALMHHAKTRK